MSRLEAALRLGGGSLFFFYFLIGGPIWTLLGLYFVLTGSFRFCAVYYYLQTRRR